MTNKESTYYVKVDAQRPDYRLIKSFLWGDSKNVNSDGNSCNPASQDWTELTLETRDEPFEYFDIDPVQKEPLVLRINSKCGQLAARTAYFLAKETKGKVAIEPNGEFLDYEFLTEEMGEDFDLKEALNRVKSSIYLQR